MSTNATRAPASGAPAVTVFGREPVAIVAAVQAALAMAISFGWLSAIGLSTQTDLAVVMVVLNALAALFLAWKTSTTLLSPVIELFKALLGLGAIYGFHLTTEQTGMAIAAITAAFALSNRKQTVPLAKGSFATA